MNIVTGTVLSEKYGHREFTIEVSMEGFFGVTIWWDTGEEVVKSKWLHMEQVFVWLMNNRDAT